MFESWSEHGLEYILDIHMLKTNNDLSDGKRRSASSAMLSRRAERTSTSLIVAKVCLQEIKVLHEAGPRYFGDASVS